MYGIYGASMKSTFERHSWQICFDDKTSPIQRWVRKWTLCTVYSLQWCGCELPFVVHALALEFLHESPGSQM